MKFLFVFILIVHMLINTSLIRNVYSLGNTSNWTTSLKNCSSSFDTKRALQLVHNCSVNTACVNLFLNNTKYLYENKSLQTHKSTYFDCNLKQFSQLLNSIVATNKENKSKEKETMEKHYSHQEKEIKYLQNVLKEKGIDTYVLINNDEHNSETINDKDKKIEYLSNFSGSSGYLIITQQDKPILYTHGLYELQAHNEVDENLFDIKIIQMSDGDEMFKTIIQKTPQTIALDGKNTSVNFFNQIKKQFTHQYPEKTIDMKVIFENNFSDVKKEENKINCLILEESFVEIKNCKKNTKPVFLHDLKYCGATTEEKINAIKKFFIEENKNVNNLLLSELDEIAYVLNLRGYDYEFSPLFYSYLLFEFNRETNEYAKITLFTITENLTDEVKKYLHNNQVTIEEYGKLINYLNKNIVQNSVSENNSEAKKVYHISLSTGINLIIYMLFKENALIQASPVVNMKAVKNQVEIENMKKAHVLDGLALLQFFHWVEKKRKTNELFEETEISLKNKIDSFRASKENFLFVSFSTISAIGSNAAVIHYNPTEKSNAKITPSIYLLDSGGQYLHGTTDVTRTIHLGVPTPEEKKAFTLVLKGHLHLRKVIFTSVTNSIALDFIARQYLYNHFYEYNHGTGHGVGLTLNVHEGGCSISPLRGNPLKPNMVLSNEPGFYLENKFGIRIENMQYVIAKEKVGNTQFLSFNDLTLYPYDKNLLDFTLLTQGEIEQINEYHMDIRNALLPIMKENPKEYDQEIIQFLIEITDPIKK